MRLFTVYALKWLNAMVAAFGSRLKSFFFASIWRELCRNISYKERFILALMQTRNRSSLSRMPTCTLIWRPFHKKKFLATGEWFYSLHWSDNVLCSISMMFIFACSCKLCAVKPISGTCTCIFLLVFMIAGLSKLTKSAPHYAPLPLLPPCFDYVFYLLSIWMSILSQTHNFCAKYCYFHRRQCYCTCICFPNKGLVTCLRIKYRQACKYWILTNRWLLCIQFLRWIRDLCVVLILAITDAADCIFVLHCDYNGVVVRIVRMD